MLYVMVVEEPVEMRSMFLINSTLRPVWTLQRRRKSVGLNGTPAEKCGFPAETCGMLHFGKCCCHSFLPHCNMWVLLHSIPVELTFARSNYKTIVMFIPFNYWYLNSNLRSSNCHDASAGAEAHGNFKFVSPCLGLRGCSAEF